MCLRASRLGMAPSDATSVWQVCILLGSVVRSEVRRMYLNNTMRVVTPAAQDSSLLPLHLLPTRASPSTLPAS